MTRQSFAAMIAILCLGVWCGVQQVRINVLYTKISVNERRILTNLRFGHYLDATKSRKPDVPIRRFKESSWK